MAVTTKNGWIFGLQELEASVASGAAVPVATETTNGTVKAANFVAVPASFADLAAVKTYLDALQASMVAAGQMSES